MNPQQEQKLDAAVRALDKLQMEHDSAILAAALSVRGAEIYRNLRAVGRETPESMKRIFALLWEIVQEAPPREVRIAMLDDGHVVTKQ